MASLQDLFRWSIQYSDQERLFNERQQDNEQPKQLSKEDRELLEAMTRTDASKMKSLVQIYLDPNNTVEEKEVALDNLEFFVQSLDNACDLNSDSVQGLLPILQGVQLRSNEDTPHDNILNRNALRMRCAWILATALQNNPKLQKQFLELGGMRFLTETLLDEVRLLENNTTSDRKGDLPLLSKLIYAISSILTNKQALKEFRELGGFKSLNFLLNLEPEALNERLEQRIENDNAETLESTAKLDAEILQQIEKEEERLRKKSESDNNSSDNNNSTPELRVIEDDVKDAARSLLKNRILSRMKKRSFSHENSNEKAEEEEEEEKEEDSYSLWLRLARRIVFLYSKLMHANEELKLAFVTDHNAETIRTLIHLLETPAGKTDVDLKEKLLKSLHCLLVENSQAPMYRYIVDSLAKNDLKKGFQLSLQTIKSKSDLDEELSHIVDQILNVCK